MRRRSLSVVIAAALVLPTGASAAQGRSVIVGPDAAQAARLNAYIAESKLPTAPLRVRLLPGGCGPAFACADPWRRTVAWPDPTVPIDPRWERIALYHELAHVRDVRHERWTRYRVTFARILGRPWLVDRRREWRLSGVEVFAVAVSLCSIDRERLDEELRVYAGAERPGYVYRPTPLQHWKICRLLSKPWR